MSLNEIKKELQNPGKGDNAMLEIVNPLEHTRIANEDFDGHMPENGGTCELREFT
jgi:hypothetical protein